jgi:hypothetical protein
VKIHSSALDTLEIRKTAELAGVTFTRFDLKGSRKRSQGYDIILSGHSPRRQNGGEDMAATWDQWGHFLGTLFDLDPEMVTPYYVDADHFHWSTGDRYRDFDIADDHVKGHNWEFSGEAVTGSYMVHACACGAIRRFLLQQTWAEFVARHG